MEPRGIAVGGNGVVWDNQATEPIITAHHLRARLMMERMLRLESQRPSLAAMNLAPV